jgi:hypothetical protein
MTRSIDGSLYQEEQFTILRQVVPDATYEVNGVVHILVESKYPRAFDCFIGELMQQMRDGSPTQLRVKSAASNYRDYEAILAEVRVVAPVTHLSDSSLPLAWVSCE